MEKFYQQYESIQQLPNTQDSDSPKIHLLDSLIRIHYNYKNTKTHKQSDANQKRFIDSGNSKQSEANTLFPKHPKIKKSSTQTFSPSKKGICNHYSDQIEEVELIRRVFFKILSIQDLEAAESKDKIFISNITQFLLDCYILTQHFMAIFLLPLNKQKWVDSEKFILCLESVQQLSLEKASFFYQEKHGHFKRIVAIQKMLCKNYLVFFKLVEFRCEGELKEEDLVFVMSMALITKNKKKTIIMNLRKRCLEVLI
jgi:hypothetical protein